MPETEISVLLFSYTYQFCLYLIGFFQVLGVTPNADKFEIKQTYFELARKYHPLINSESPKTAAAATQAFQKIRQAYEDMLIALVDSVETTLNNENKKSPISVDSDTFITPPTSPRLSPQEALILNQMSNLIPYKKKSLKKLK